MMTSAFPVSENSASASAPRQHASRVAHSLGFSETRAGQVALVVSELATNVAKHAGEGHILIHEIRDGDRIGIEVFALDKGPGLPHHAMQDGYSTAGSLGTGLGAIRRQADQFEIYTQPNMGTLILCRMWSEAGSNQGRVLSGINVPKSGESVSGDAWAYHLDAARFTVIVVDGLGHGPQAADAASAAIRVFRQRPALAPADLIEEIHSALRATRGAAVSVAAIDRERQIVRFTGVGNVAASMVSPHAPRQGLAQHNGTAGVTMRRVQEFTYPIRPHDVLVMHSDGIGTHWNAENHAGLWARDPALIAAAIYRDHTRGRDDATVVVARLDR